MLGSVILLTISLGAGVFFVIRSQAESATISVRCPGGEVYFEGVTLKDRAELTVPPRATTFELRPPGKPPQVVQFNLQPRQFVVIDCAVE
jgi:hypothetical protein